MTKQESKLHAYYTLAKPRMVYGNTIATLAGFLFASRWHFEPTLLLATLFGIALVIASACIFNNYFDQDIDKKMSRTKSRALAREIIPPWHALALGVVLGVLGILILYICANLLAALVASVGFLFYTALYTPIKRRSHWAAIVGSVSGAVPILVGYIAAVKSIDALGVLLFMILVLWQIPHFYAIAIRRLDEYAAASIPVFSIEKGIYITKLHIAVYIVLFIIAESLLTILGYAGYVYLAAVLAVGLVWFVFALQGFTVKDDTAWARKLFLFSLVVLIVFLAALVFAPLLP